MHELVARAYIHRIRRTHNLFIYNLKVTVTSRKDIYVQPTLAILLTKLNSMNDQYSLSCNFLKWVNPGSVSTFEIAYLDFFLWMYTCVCEQINMKYNTQHNCLPDKNVRTTRVLGADIFLNESIQGVFRQSPSVVLLDSCRAIDPNSSPRIKRK